MSMRYSSVSNHSEEQKLMSSTKIVRQSQLFKHLLTQQLCYFSRESLREGVEKLQPPVRRLQHFQNLKKKADQYSESHGQYLKDCVKHIHQKFYYYRDIKSGVRNQDLYLAIMISFIQKAIEGGQNCLHDLLQIVNESVGRSRFVMGQYRQILLGYLKQLYYQVSEFSNLSGLILFYEMLLYSEEFHLILSQAVKSMVVHFYKRVQGRSQIHKYPNMMSETGKLL